MSYGFVGDGRRQRKLELVGGALDLGTRDWRKRESKVAEYFGEKSERVAGFFWRDIQEGEF